MTLPDELTCRIAFASLRSLSPELAQAILDRVGSEENFFALGEGALSAAMGFSNRIFTSAVRTRALDEAGREARFVTDNSIRPIYFRDEAYPRRLLLCPDAPLMLYGMGTCDLNAPRFVSIVGTRHATAYGNAFVEDLVAGFATNLTEKPVIVSGLAFGIDIAAHRAALKAGLPTVAVLAHGLNTIYPAQHRQIAVEIATRGGMLLTDYRSIDALHRGNFLARNRIVAGLSDCTIVAESASKGGALATARIASGYGRDVFALPGRTSDIYSQGCNRLIRDCVAALAGSAADVAAHMRWSYSEPSSPSAASLFPDISDEEQPVIDLITEHGEASFSQISARTSLPTAHLRGMLMDLEFRSVIVQLPGGRYRLR